MLRRNPLTSVFPRLLLVGAIAGIAACGSGEGAGGEGEAGRAAGAEARASTGRSGPSGAEASPEGDVRGAVRAASPDSAALPDGGLEAWVEDMRASLEEIELDPRASYRDVVSVYTTYHAAIARYYGAGGELTGDDYPELAAAVQREEAAFRELLDLTGTTDYIERTHLLHAIRTLRLAVESVLDRARAAGVPLDPRAAVSSYRPPVSSARRLNT